MFGMTHPAARVTLPGGLWLENRNLQDAGLQPLTGYDEAYLLSLSIEERGALFEALGVAADSLPELFTEHPELDQLYAFICGMGI